MKNFQSLHCLKQAMLVKKEKRVQSPMWELFQPQFLKSINPYWKMNWVNSDLSPVWVNSRSLWWTGRPGVLWFMGSQRVGHDWVTELNWSESSQGKCKARWLIDAKQRSQRLTCNRCLRDRHPKVGTDHRWRRAGRSGFLPEVWGVRAWRVRLNLPTQSPRPWNSFPGTRGCVT